MESSESPDRGLPSGCKGKRALVDPLGALAGMFVAGSIQYAIMKDADVQGKQLHDVAGVAGAVDGVEADVDGVVGVDGRVGEQGERSVMTLWCRMSLMMDGGNGAKSLSFGVRLRFDTVEHSNDSVTRINEFVKKTVPGGRMRFGI